VSTSVVGDMHMTEENQEQKASMFESKFWRTTLIIIAVLLVFVGPTYMVHILIINLGVNYWVSMAAGFLVFIVGVLLLVYLFRKKIIS
jgi:hypothetical protein